MLEANEMKVLRKIVGKTKVDTLGSQQIRESNLLMAGWKEGEEENETNM